MKKTVKLIALVLALSMIAVLAVGTAFATGSKQQDVTVVVEDGYVIVKEDDATKYTASIADFSKILGVPEDDLAIIRAFDIEKVGTPKADTVEITFKYDGLQAGQKAFVFHQKHDGSWELKAAVNTPYVQNVNDCSPFVIVVDKEGIANTGDNNLTIAIICAAVVALGAAGTAITVSLKKKKA